MALKDIRTERVVATCHGCESPIHSGQGWRRVRNPAFDPQDPYSEEPKHLDYHHQEESEPTGEMTLDGQHELRRTRVVKSCVPKESTRKRRVAS